jgi:hypothetical protein
VVEGEEGKFAYILWTRQASPDTMQTSTAGKVRRAHSGRLEIGTDILLVNGTEVVKDDVQIKDLIVSRPWLWCFGRLNIIRLGF